MSMQVNNNSNSEKASLNQKSDAVSKLPNGLSVRQIETNPSTFSKKCSTVLSLAMNVAKFACYALGVIIYSVCELAGTCLVGFCCLTLGL